MTMAERAQALAAELRPGIEPDPDPRAAMPGDDATEQDRAVRVAGERQRFTALDKTLAGDPSAAPDQRAFLVVTPPYETGLRGNGIQPFAAHEASEYRIALPARCAHPHDLAPGADDGPALPISEQRIVTQGMRGHRLKTLLRAVAHAARLPPQSGPPGYPARGGLCVIRHGGRDQPDGPRGGRRGRHRRVGVTYGYPVSAVPPRRGRRAAPGRPPAR
jgi:hypothetical protein